MPQGHAPGASRALWRPLTRLRRRETGGGAIGQAMYAAHSFIRTLPPVEQVAAPVGGFHAIGVDVGKGELAHLARRVSALRGPVPEARSKPVRDGVDAEVRAASRSGRRG